jgi:hypothetical protein
VAHFKGRSHTEIFGFRTLQAIKEEAVITAHVRRRAGKDANGGLRHSVVLMRHHFGLPRRVQWPNAMQAGLGLIQLVTNTQDDQAPALVHGARIGNVHRTRAGSAFVMLIVLCN